MWFFLLNHLDVLGQMLVHALDIIISLCVWFISVCRVLGLLFLKASFCIFYV